MFLKSLFITSSSDASHSGIVILKVVEKFSLFINEYSGLDAGVGYMVDYAS